MKFFLDTEFIEDGKTIEPISLGVVSERGNTFYTEFNFNEEKARQNPFVVEHVLPHLKFERFRRQRMTRKNVAAGLVSFVEWECYGSKPEFWAYYADYDWVLICQLFGRMVDLPELFPKLCLDVQQLWITLGKPDVRPPKPDNEHHALADAQWTKQFYKALRNQVVDR